MLAHDILFRAYYVTDMTYISIKQRTDLRAFVECVPDIDVNRKT